ncbi:MAG: hypothetical protein M0Q51_08240 [Bacteroidales bacterium]|nr:hypothetical protein [Bacteroidales bacterium]
MKTKQFEEDNSPVQIKNIIAYRFSENEIDTLNTVEDNFWVSKISNYSTNGFIGSRYPENCGKKSMYSEKYYLYSSPGNFYIKYIKDLGTEVQH